MDYESQVNDVTAQRRPQPTARPVIVGHHPQMPDPMVREQASQNFATGHAPQHVAAMQEPQFDQTPVNGPGATIFAASDEHSVPVQVNRVPAQPPLNPHPQLLGMPPAPPRPVAMPPQMPVDIPSGHGPHHDKKGGGWWKWLLVLIFLLIVAYLSVDYFTTIKLPFELFKKSTPAPAAVTAPAATTPTQTTTSLPSGFTSYQITGTTVSFGYPTAWGAPATTPDPGFSKRGGTNKSDGTYAYLVNFATNKDVQVVVTSDKFLPTTRTALYYDYLQWCKGTNDGKFYKSSLKFNTTAGVDTPSTVVCDQGPLSSATSTDKNTIVETATPDAKLTLYTYNLSLTDLVVLRVKDATSQNGDNIKLLLANINTTNTSANSNQ